MRFEIYQAPFADTAWGYTPVAGYERVWSGEVPDPLGDAGDALEMIFVGFQRVDPETGPWPPESYVGRSLSVGDVVVLDGWAPFAVESEGFAAAPGFLDAAGSTRATP